MNYLVTGGSGYLGSEIVNYLLDKKHKVLNIDINKQYNENKNYDFKQIDILNNLELEKVFNNIDVVIHSVAKVPLIKNDEQFQKTNVMGTKNLLQLSLNKKIKKFVFISSSAVYGISGKSPINENSERIPCENYGKSKKIGENLCSEFKKKGLNASILRPRTIIGGNRLGIFSILFWWIKNDKKIPVINGGNNFYQFIDVNDLVEAIYLTSLYEKNEDFNIGAEQYFSIKDNINHLIKKYNSNSKVCDITDNFFFKSANYLSKTNLIPLQEYHLQAYGKDIFFDITKAKKLLKWEPKYSNKVSFENSFDLYNKKLIINENQSSPHQKIIKNILMRFGTTFI